MKHVKYLLAAATIGFLLAGCSTSNQVVPDSPPSQLYSVAQKNLDEGDFKAAIKQLEALDTRYPYGPYSQQVQLDLIYAYYKSSDYLLAQTTIDRFIRLNPTYQHLDYVLYMRGLTDIAMGENWLQDIAGIDSANRDPQYTFVAFNDLKQLLVNFPNSPYAADAQKQLVFLKNQLAKHELAVAQYYTRRGVYTAVINRVEDMLQKYPDTQATKQGLPLMQQAYINLHLTAQANKVAQLIAANQ